jgi:hypothetical protein
MCRARRLDRIFSPVVIVVPHFPEQKTYAPTEIIPIGKIISRKSIQTVDKFKIGAIL